MAKRTAKKSVTTITGGKIEPFQVGAITSPHLLYDGEPVEEGTVVEFKHENDITYRGTVAECVSIDGECVIEFAGPLQPI